MALVAHTIISRYTPEEREPITEPAVAEDDPWQTESSFSAAQRLHSRPAPYFVAAALEYDEYGMPKHTAGPGDHPFQATNTAEDVSVWYRTLTSKGKARQKDESKSSHPSSQSPSTQPIASSADASSSHIPAEDKVPRSTPPLASSITCKPTKPNWFTSHSLPSDSPHHTSKPSTLADLLSRNPPPLPSEPAFKPPVFLAIGPGNRGFTMLERKGWREGEGLGSGRIERRAREGLGMKRSIEEAFQWKLDGEDRKPILRPQLCRTAKGLPNNTIQEVIDLTLSDDEDDTGQEIVDLTLSDSEAEPEPKVEESEDLLPSPEFESVPSPHGTTLLTPIATTLKADRLGIGLKRARTSKAKAVTHTSAALAAHIRSSNQMRKEKARHGRGSCGLARKKRNEERERVGLLAYMNV